jgi:hypothetical protein
MGPARPMGRIFLRRNPWAGPGQLIFAMDIHAPIFEQKKI